jgi:hypothetical protein
VGVTAEDFRRKSAACKAAAMLESNQDRKRELFDLARAWFHLAEYTERHPDWQSRFVIADDELIARGPPLRPTRVRRVSPERTIRLVYSAESPRTM